VKMEVSLLVKNVSERPLLRSRKRTPLNLILSYCTTVHNLTPYSISFVLIFIFASMPRFSKCLSLGGEMVTCLKLYKRVASSSPAEAMDF
jgi:hypothetical protein